jgi:hypothetical protein
MSYILIFFCSPGIDAGEVLCAERTAAGLSLLVEHGDSALKHLHPFSHCAGILLSLPGIFIPAIC